MYSNIFQSKHSTLIISLCFGFTLIGCFMFILAFNPTKAHAVAENTANVPQFIQDSFYNNTNCVNSTPPPYNFHQAQFAWVSVAGDNSVTSVDVPSGTDRVDLWMNTLDALCDGAINGQDTNLKVTRYNVVSANATAGSVNGFSGSVDVDLSSAYFFNSRWAKELNIPAGIDRPWIMPFNITGLAGLSPGDHDITVNATMRVVNEFGGPAYQCVAEPRQYTSGLDGPDCNTYVNSFTIKIRVGQPRINGYFDNATCTEFTGWAVDQDAPNSPVTVQFFADAPAGAPGSVYVGSTSANQPSYPGEPGWLNGHRFNYVPPSWLFSSSTHRIYAYGLGVLDSSHSLQLPTSRPGSQGYYDMGPCAGTVYVSKYAPPSHPADGKFSNVNNAINDAQVCFQNQGGTEFACNTNYTAGNGVAPGNSGNTYRRNGYRQDGIWSLGAPHNPYKVNIYVPPGWKLDHITDNRNGIVNVGFTCLGPNTGYNGTEKCVSNGIFVTGGSWSWFDIWYQQIPNVSCSPMQLLDPANNNLPFGTSPEVSQPMVLGFGAPIGVPGGITLFKVEYINSSPGGLTGLGTNYGPAAVGSQILTGNITSAQAQVYTVNYRVSWFGSGGIFPDGFKDCTGTITVTNKPYVSVYGNSVKAGASMAVNGICAPPSNPKATILTFDRGAKTGPNTENWKGGSVQYAAFALGEIDQFFSVNQKNPRTTSANSDQALPVLDLTFGNYNPANSIFSHNPSANSGLYDTRKVEGYGGVNVDSSTCVQDYYERISTKGGTASNANIGNRTINGPVAEYRNGDVIISGNIDFPANMTDGSIPSYYLAVKGNIYIQQNVSKLSGVFIAEDDGSGNKGRIYTCAAGNGLYNSTELYDECNNTQLIVNGAFIAKQIKFQRTIYSLRDGSPNEPVATSHAAEIFNFTPETYIAKPDPSLATGSTKVRYDYITSLPPIL